MHLKQCGGTEAAMMIRRFSELAKLPAFEERFEYLKLDGKVGADTFGFDRIFNQMFYRSAEWKRVRNGVIVRDNGCDLGAAGHDIFGETVIVHHMNPLTLDDIKNSTEFLLDPEYLITTTLRTHNAIHYGGTLAADMEVTERRKGDMCPWWK
ncbi:MAG: hypothetical protein NC078_11590 [Ruminococcus sp.]|nr:hypothetical protein [Ruminococcus sp.]